MSADALASSLAPATPRASRACSRSRRRARAPVRPAPAREREAGWIGAAVTLALHAALLLALLGLRTPAPAEPPTPPAAAVLMELSLLPRAPPAPARDLPPGPAQDERIASRAQPPRETARETPLPPQAQGDIASAPEPAPVSAPREAPPVQNQTAASASAPPDVAAAPAPRYAAAQDVAGTGRELPRQWQQLLLGHLERFKRYPRQARRLHQQGVAQVRLTVAGDGRVLAVRIETASGHAALDAEALAVAERASPVPAPPAEFGDEVQVVVPMEFYISR